MVTETFRYWQTLKMIEAFWGLFGRFFFQDCTKANCSFVKNSAQAEIWKV